MTARHISLVIIAFLVFTGPTVAQQNYRSMAAEAIWSQIFDLFSIKKAMITPPKKYKNGSIALCATFYAKNRSGAYGGKLIWSVIFTKDGSRVRFAHDITGMGSSCEAETGYTSFKELENF
jgi:hypothetical protein